MIPAHEIAHLALATVLRRAPLSPEKVTLAWRMSVGAPVAQATSSVELREGVLLVTARDAAWRNEVERSAALIRRRVNDLLDEEEGAASRRSGDAGPSAGRSPVRELRVTVPSLPGS